MGFALVLSLTASLTFSRALSLTTGSLCRWRDYAWGMIWWARVTPSWLVMLSGPGLCHWLSRLLVVQQNFGISADFLRDRNDLLSTEQNSGTNKYQKSRSSQSGQITLGVLILVGVSKTIHKMQNEGN